MSRRVTDKLGKLLIITSFILFAIAAYMSNIVNHQYDSEGRLVAGSGNLFITVRPEDELTAEDVNDNGATGGEKTPDNTGEVDNPNAGGLSLIPGQGTRSHILQLRVHRLKLKNPHPAMEIEDPAGYK